MGQIVNDLGCQTEKSLKSLAVSGSLLHLRYLVQWTHGRCSTNICWVNEWHCPVDNTELELQPTEDGRGVEIQAFTKFHHNPPPHHSHTILFLIPQDALSGEREVFLRFKTFRIMEMPRKSAKVWGFFLYPWHIETKLVTFVVKVLLYALPERGADSMGCRWSLSR